MILINQPEKGIWPQLISRPSEDNSVIGLRVSEILADVKERGDAALKELTFKYDNVSVETLCAGKEELKAFALNISDQLKAAIEIAAKNIEMFHKAQRCIEVDVTTTPGVRCILRKVPVERVGLYIPGGSAPLFSTVLMLALPAKIAGCKEIVLCTPPDKNGNINPAIAFAALRAGVTEVIKAGGAQAIGAMAYGTESVKRVDKIFGPGNQYVSIAKQMVSSKVSIDMVAGPSELMVIADKSSIPQFVAADLLSQAEHGADSQVILLCDTEELARDCFNEIQIQKESFSRKIEIDGALSASKVIVFKERIDMAEFANYYAPEHLILAVNNPWEMADSITAAGSVFIGNYTPESAGDYCSGTNHTLPTNGWARSSGSLSLDSFMKTITFQEITEKGIEALAPVIISMASAEGLQAHRYAAEIRVNNKQ